MSKNVKDTDTEQLIKETAKRIFFAEGKFNATTQEIAEAAGVNRTLLHYYFRSRDALFEIVFTDARARVRARMKEVMLSEQPFKEKISQFIDSFYEESKKYPYLETYLVTQINQQLDKELSVIQNDSESRKALNKFFGEVEAEIENGVIANMHPVQFLLNLMSLMAFPIAMKPLFQGILSISDRQYGQLLADRKTIIIGMLFKK